MPDRQRPGRRKRYVQPKRHAPPSSRNQGNGLLDSYRPRRDDSGADLHDDQDLRRTQEQDTWTSHQAGQDRARRTALTVRDSEQRRHEDRVNAPSQPESLGRSAIEQEQHSSHGVPHFASSDRSYNDPRTAPRAIANDVSNRERYADLYDLWRCEDPDCPNPTEYHVNLTVARDMAEQVPQGDVDQRNWHRRQHRSTRTIIQAGNKFNYSGFAPQSQDDLSNLQVRLVSRTDGKMGVFLLYRSLTNSSNSAWEGAFVYSKSERLTISDAASLNNRHLSWGAPFLTRDGRKDFELDKLRAAIEENKDVLEPIIGNNNGAYYSNLPSGAFGVADIHATETVGFVHIGPMVMAISNEDAHRIQFERHNVEFDAVINMCRELGFSPPQFQSFRHGGCVNEGLLYPNQQIERPLKNFTRGDVLGQQKNSWLQNGIDKPVQKYNQKGKRQSGKNTSGVSIKPTNSAPISNRRGYGSQSGFQPSVGTVRPAALTEPLSNSTRRSSPILVHADGVGEDVDTEKATNADLRLAQPGVSARRTARDVQEETEKVDGEAKSKIGASSPGLDLSDKENKDNKGARPQHGRGKKDPVDNKATNVHTSLNQSRNVYALEDRTSKTARLDLTGPAVGQTSEVTAPARQRKRERESTPSADIEATTNKKQKTG